MYGGGGGGVAIWPPGRRVIEKPLLGATNCPGPCFTSVSGPHFVQ